MFIVVVGFLGITTWGGHGIVVAVCLAAAIALPWAYSPSTGKKTPAQQTAALHEEMTKLQEKIDATTTKLTAIEKHMHTCGVKDWLVYDGRAK
jgi:hypothetical protein